MATDAALRFVRDFVPCARYANGRHSAVVLRTNMYTLTRSRRRIHDRWENDDRVVNGTHSCTIRRAEPTGLGAVSALNPFNVGYRE